LNELTAKIAIFKSGLFLNKKRFAIAFGVGVVIRLLLMPITAHPGDMYVWYGLSTKIIHDGPTSVSFFPPINGYFLLVPISYTYTFLANIFSIHPIPISSFSTDLIFYPELHQTIVPDVLFNFLIKLPIFIADILSAFLIMKIISQSTSNKIAPYAAALIWFLNPYLIWISAVWGMWDSIAALLTIGCLYFLVKKQLLLSSICLLIGIIVKLYPLLFLFPVAYYLWASYKNKIVLLKYFAVIFVGIMIMLLISINDLSDFFSGFLLLRYNSANIIFNSPRAFGLTYWSIDTLNLVTVSKEVVSLLSLILLVVCFGIVCLKIKKISFQTSIFDLTISFSLMLFAFYLAFRLVLDQWVVWVLPFLVILYGGKKINSWLFYSVTFLALVYSLLNCPLPFFFLPLTPIASNTLLAVVHLVWALWPLRLFALIISGCCFSISILLIAIRISKKV
jgi:Gpi18-like mannosyltransferase